MLALEPTNKQSFSMHVHRRVHIKRREFAGDSVTNAPLSRWKDNNLEPAQPSILTLFFAETVFARFAKA